MTTIKISIIKVIYLFTLILLIIPNFSYSVENGVPNKKDNIKNDTTIIIQKVVDAETIQNYQEILEKTNNQMSLWWNPFGLLVAILGVLFAILAIVAAFVIFRQSKEYKNLISKSLQDHKIALEKLIDEKNSYLKNYELNLEQLIIEYKALANGEDLKEKVVESIIVKLEEQRKIVDTQLQTFMHSGWKHKDIVENIKINEASIFYSNILLNSTTQNFTIYIGLRTNDKRRFWIGFTNSGEDLPYRTKSEYKVYHKSTSKRETINENIATLFREGFPKLDLPVTVDCIRVRGENSDLREIAFSYKII